MPAPPGRGAAEEGVAVREAAEAGNLVLRRADLAEREPVGRLLRPRHMRHHALSQRRRPLQPRRVARTFGRDQRHEEEELLSGLGPRLDPAGAQPLLRQPQGQRPAGEGLRPAGEQAGQQDQQQPADWRRGTTG
jgi:hypothetical protein